MLYTKQVAKLHTCINEKQWMYMYMNSIINLEHRRELKEYICMMIQYNVMYTLNFVTL